MQTVSLEAADVVEYLPTPHAIQPASVLIPLNTVYLPEAHGMQDVTDEAPTLELYLPAAQC